MHKNYPFISVISDSLKFPFERSDVQPVTSTTQISSSPAPGATWSYKRGSEDRVTAVLPFHLDWRKCLSITSLSGGESVATLPPGLPLERLVAPHGELLNTCNPLIQQPGIKFSPCVCFKSRTEQAWV